MIADKDNITDKDNIIASLRDQIREERANLLGPTPGLMRPKKNAEKDNYDENHLCADPAPSCVSGVFEDFVITTDLLALSCIN